MPELDLIDNKNNKVGSVEASPAVFGVKPNAGLVQQYVTMQLAARRSGTACTISNRGDIRGSGRKPWRQKGTGRARAGTTRSPLWRGGMTVFGPTPRQYTLKLSKKSKKIAIKSVLTERAQTNGLTVVEKLELENPKTREAAQLLKDLGLPDKTLFLLSEENRNLTLAVRNLPNADTLAVEGLNVFDLLTHERIVCTPDTIKKLEERLS